MQFLNNLFPLSHLEKTEKITVTKMKQVSTPVDVSDTDKNNSADRYEDPPKSRPAIPQAAAHFEENRRPQYNVMTVNDSPSSQSDFSQQEFLQHSQASWDSAPTVASPTSSTSSQKPVHKVPQKVMLFVSFSIFQTHVISLSLAYVL